MQGVIHSSNHHSFIQPSFIHPSAHPCTFYLLNIMMMTLKTTPPDSTWSSVMMSLILCRVSFIHPFIHPSIHPCTFYLLNIMMMTLKTTPPDSTWFSVMMSLILCRVSFIHPSIHHSSFIPSMYVLLTKHHDDDTEDHTTRQHMILCDDVSHLVQGGHLSHQGVVPRCRQKHSTHQHRQCGHQGSIRRVQVVHSNHLDVVVEHKHEEDDQSEWEKNVDQWLDVTLKQRKKRNGLNVIYLLI